MPASWADVPEQRLLSSEVRHQIKIAIDRLPESQRAVLVMRDVEGVGAQEVCNILGLSETNQRVLLHRGRARVRHMLAQYLTGD